MIPRTLISMRALAHPFISTQRTLEHHDHAAFHADSDEERITHESAAREQMDMLKGMRHILISTVDREERDRIQHYVMNEFPMHQARRYLMGIGMTREGALDTLARHVRANAPVD